jgi:phosphohistidine phosphatase
MEVFLVQHGEAEAESIDPARPLTPQGREDVERAATVAARLGVEVHQIRHSYKTRAEQTAAILGKALSPPGGVVPAPGLAPRDEVHSVAEMLEREPKPLMLVGHMPFMARLAGLLITGDADRPVVQFRQGGIVCLVHQEGRWSVDWVLTPALAAVAG